MQENVAADNHGLTLENQSRANFTGIVSVESFNEKQVSVKTAGRSIIISGENLTVSKFNTENGTLAIEGRINEIRYIEKGKAAGVLKRLFK